MKDVERFLAELEAPVAGGLKVVTDHDLEADAQSFMAFAGMMGVKPPRPNDGDESSPALPSA